MHKIKTIVVVRVVVTLAAATTGARVVYLLLTISRFPEGEPGQIFQEKLLKKLAMAAALGSARNGLPAPAVFFLATVAKQGRSRGVSVRCVGLVHTQPNPSYVPAALTGRGRQKF